jgi:hypothetical protein
MTLLLHQVNYVKGKADRYARRNSVEDAIIYRVRPQKIVSEKSIAD